MRAQKKPFIAEIKRARPRKELPSNRRVPQIKGTAATAAGKHPNSTHDRQIEDSRNDQQTHTA
jgi:hypothetical protein